MITASASVLGMLGCVGSMPTLTVEVGLVVPYVSMARQAARLAFIDWDFTAVWG